MKEMSDAKLDQLISQVAKERGISYTDAHRVVMAAQQLGTQPVAARAAASTRLVPSAGSRQRTLLAAVETVASISNSNLSASEDAALKTVKEFYWRNQPRFFSFKRDGYLHHHAVYGAVTSAISEAQEGGAFSDASVLRIRSEADSLRQQVESAGPEEAA